jgi:hypothetical protein
MGEIEVDHDVRAKNQIRFANLRQYAEGSMALDDAGAAANSAPRTGERGRRPPLSAGKGIQIF